MFVCLSWHPFLLRSGFFLSPYPSFQQDTSLKRASAGTSKIDFSPLPTIKPCPPTFGSRLHHVLYWLGTGWWCLGLAHASFPCVSKIYLLVIRLPWFGGLPAVRFLCPFMRAAFRFPVLLKSWALFGTGPYISFGQFLNFPHFLPYYSVIPAVMTQSCWASLGQPFTLSPSGLV